MITFAEVTILPAGPGLWLLVGLAAGAFAGLVLRGGVAQDMGVGLAGALIGGALFGLIAPGFWGGIIGAFAGACALIAAMRELRPAPPRA
jgi:uncharacterized membrane protein YeaQ/YmgE (transglycosylase-associated protein family)